MQTYSYTIVTAPDGLAVTGAEMEAHARAAGQPPEQYEPYIAAAQGWVEQVTNRKLVTQTWKWFLDRFPSCDRVCVPFGQLQSVTHIKYTDSADAQSTLSSTYYSVSTARDPGVIALKYAQTWPTATLRTLDPVEIQFVCGWTSPSEVPADIRAAILLVAAHLYEHREDVVLGNSASVESKALEMGSRALLANWRVHL